MTAITVLPLIGITACLKEQDGMPTHAVRSQYVEAVVQGAAALPLIIPAIGTALEIERLIDQLDGLLITGSPSNVAPEHYGGPAAREGNLADPARDATTLPLLRAAVAAGLPLLAICRGIQELNVAMGGTLHQHVQELPGRLDHRSDKSKARLERYEPCHAIEVAPSGCLATVLGRGGRIMVNSLHGQAIDRLAPGLTAEALVEDGTIEAVSVDGAASFALALQWHPEYAPLKDPQSRALFAAFGAAARARAASRVTHAQFSRVA